MDKSEVTKKSRIINQKAINYIDWSQIKTMHVYTSLKPLNEIDTDELQSFLAQHQPQIEVTTSPARKDAKMPNEQFDLIIVPVLAFDKNNYRLGMGGGWYDRFLASQKKAETIGLAYADALIDSLPIESHDIALSRIISN